MGPKSSILVAGVVVVLALTFASEMSTVNAARFIVGDNQHWTFGYNYTDWAQKNAPFHVNDTLVFMYDPPSNLTHPHSVYLMNNLKSYLSCNLKKSRMVGNVIQGAGSGFEFTLKRRKPHYFACGERDGFHCTVGQMKFVITPKRPCRG
ncbi:Copper ion binding protein [Rhynchospora pubera]|uniref:Copper ion binding protein n=1 Tax=Rhynchospora pubera TaxID=906938 RepID=A0AAV8FL84_9POAL|nr:Copper ion binding protein [Rhynchospora pubera]KAJ4817579.1 Copper ion binding protein [Rhynchospora pubera]